MATPPSVEGFWDKDQIREWALREFPDAFRALPDVTELEFVDKDQRETDTGCWSDDCGTTLLAVGVYDDSNSGPGKPKDKVFAFIIDGRRRKGVGFIRERSAYGPYDWLNTITRQSVDFAEPFCDIKNFYSPPESNQTVVGMLGSLIRYYFLAAGHLNHIRNDDLFRGPFRKACLCIANGGFEPNRSANRASQAIESLPVSRRRDSSGRFIQSSNTGVQALPGVGQSLSESLTECVDDLRVSSKRSAVADIANDEEDAERKAARNQSNFQVLIRHAGNTYQSLGDDNKRLRLDISEARTNESKLKETIKDLLEKNTSLQSQLADETNRNGMLYEKFLTLEDDLTVANEEVCRAEGKVKEASTQAKKEYEKKEQQLEDEKQKEKTRADEAEKKLANIQAIFRNAV